jgi:hypothetical protein
LINHWLNTSIHLFVAALTTDSRLSEPVPQRASRCAATFSPAPTPFFRLVVTARHHEHFAFVGGCATCIGRSAYAALRFTTMVKIIRRSQVRIAALWRLREMLLAP